MGKYIYVFGGQKSSEIIYIEYNVQKQIIGETNCPIVMSNIWTVIVLC
jgi:hypothetical protein